MLIFHFFDYFSIMTQVLLEIGIQYSETHLQDIYA